MILGRTILPLALSLFFTLSANAETSLYQHSKVRTGLQKMQPSKGLDEGAISGILSRLRAQPKITKITLAADGAKAATLWEKSAKDHQLNQADSSTLQCLAALLSQRMKPGSEERIACKFFKPQKFIAVLLHKDGALELQTGPLKSVDPKVGPTSKSIIAQYKINSIVDSDAKWTAEELAIVDEALSMLTPRELKLLRDIPFVRERNKKGSASGNVAGFYGPARGPLGCKIYIYDNFTRNKGIILGTPQKHYGSGTMTLLHELAHALASSAFRKKENAPKDTSAKPDLKAQRDAAYEIYKAAREDYNNQAKSLSQEERNKLIDALNKKTYAFNDLDNAYKKVAKAINAETTKQTREGKPAEFAMKKILPVRQSVTPYGRTSPAESFAEAYMLFKLDPDALKRISMETFSFFESEKYLDIIDEELSR